MWLTECLLYNSRLIISFLSEFWRHCSIVFQLPVLLLSSQCHYDSESFTCDFFSNLEAFMILFLSRRFWNFKRGYLGALSGPYQSEIQFWEIFKNYFSNFLPSIYLFISLSLTLVCCLCLCHSYYSDVVSPGLIFLIFLYLLSCFRSVCLFVLLSERLTHLWYNLTF